jgi:hypothetical protein
MFILIHEIVTLGRSGTKFVDENWRFGPIKARRKTELRGRKKQKDKKNPKAREGRTENNKKRVRIWGHY